MEDVPAHPIIVINSMDHVDNLFQIINTADWQLGWALLRVSLLEEGQYDTGVRRHAGRSSCF